MPGVAAGMGLRAGPGRTCTVRVALCCTPTPPCRPPPQPDALFVIVPALALPTKLAAAAYILMFVLGTVAAMGAYTGIIGEPPCHCCTATVWAALAASACGGGRAALTRVSGPSLPAGATSAAIKKSNSGLTQKLSGFAALLALALGATMVLSGLGIDLPFALPQLPFFSGGHAH